MVFFLFFLAFSLIATTGSSYNEELLSCPHDHLLIPTNGWWPFSSNKFACVPYHEISEEYTPERPLCCQYDQDVPVCVSTDPGNALFVTKDMTRVIGFKSTTASKQCSSMCEAYHKIVCVHRNYLNQVGNSLYLTTDSDEDSNGFLFVKKHFRRKQIDDSVI